MTGAKPTFGGKLMFPTEFLASEDLGGKDFDVTIESVQAESLRTTDGATDKFTVRFKGARKRLVLNKTNAKLIAMATGEPEARKWPGKRITLYGTTCAAFGETVTCIRVRETAPRQTPPAASESTESDAPPKPDYLQQIAGAVIPEDLDVILREAAGHVSETEMGVLMASADVRRTELEE